MREPRASFALTKKRSVFPVCWFSAIKRADAIKRYQLQGTVLILNFLFFSQRSSYAGPLIKLGSEFVVFMLGFFSLLVVLEFALLGYISRLCVMWLSVPFA